jgi:hypothetical protein
MLSNILKQDFDKFWYSIGMTTVTIIYAWVGFHGGNFENDTIVYAGLIGSTNVLNTMNKLKYGTNNAPKS